MSFLERQLQQIASSKAPLPTKARASLLFDPKAAADVDRETIFELGLSGFQKLVSLDSQFNQFGETLFSTAMKSQDRMLLVIGFNIDCSRKLCFGQEYFPIPTVIISVLSPKGFV